MTVPQFIHRRSGLQLAVVPVRENNCKPGHKLDCALFNNRKANCTLPGTDEDGQKLCFAGVRNIYITKEQLIDYARYRMELT